MVYIFALAAALSNALTSIFQRMGVEDAPEEDRMRARLLLNALKRGIWLLGFACMVGSFVLQAIALHLGRLSEVQPLLTAELLFLVLILGVWFRFPVSWRDFIAVSAVSLGLSGFLSFANPKGGDKVPHLGDWVFVMSTVVVAMLIFATLGSKGPRWWKAAWLGGAAAVGYAMTAALTKIVSNQAVHQWTSLYRHWQPYALAGFGITAVFLTQNAFHAGPIAASQSTLVLLDPIVSIIIGIELFGDRLDASALAISFQVLSLSVMCLGAVYLCRSPLIKGTKGDAATDLLTLRLGRQSS